MIFGSISKKVKTDQVYDLEEVPFGYANVDADDAMIHSYTIYFIKVMGK